MTFCCAGTTTPAMITEKTTTDADIGGKSDDIIASLNTVLTVYITEVTVTICTVVTLPHSVCSIAIDTTMNVRLTHSTVY